MGSHADRAVEVVVDGGERLEGVLVLPADVAGIVVVAHGAGSSGHSPRNRHVAALLADDGLATLLFDLLTPREARDRSNVFDVPLLAARLTAATAWVRTEPSFAELRIGWFGASTGAAAALWAAAESGSDVAAVVSRGGRPDLASERLCRVTAPTLLIVGGADDVVLDLNRGAYERLRCERDLAVVPGATHLFAEPGALDRVAVLASEWFVRHLTA